MGVMAKKSGQDFENCPAGTFPGICVDIIDLGEQETPFKIEKGPNAGEAKFQHQIQIVWQVAAEDESGEPILRTDGLMHRLSKFYNLSLNETATLRKDLDSWRGKAFTNEELESGWDVENVLGAQCQLVIIPKGEDGKVKISNVLSKHRKDPVITPDEYIREKDRPGGKDTRSPAEGSGKKAAGSGRSPVRQVEEESEDLDDSELPF